MRTIRKRSPPVSYVEWKRTPPTPGRKRDYEDLRNALGGVIADVEDSLFREQGGICAYTGKSLGEPAGQRKQFHVEHIEPGEGADAPGSIEYSNMLACWPEPDRPEEPGFGAREKGAWWNAGEFVSPLSSGSGARFKFSWTGRIEPAREADEAARRTIEVLALNHRNLVAWRRQAIYGELRPRGVLVSPRKAGTLLNALEEAAARLDAGLDERLEEYEFVLRDMLRRHSARK